MNLKAIALCDHDTTDGILPMQECVTQVNRDGQRILFIPSVELSTGIDGRTHLLGYGVQPDNAALRLALLQLRHQRVQRGVKMVEALAAVGITVPQELLPAADNLGMPIGRPHVARALMKIGAVKTMEQAFDRYLGEGKVACIPLEHMCTMEAITLLRHAGAIPVLAHPARTGLPSQMLEALIASFQTVGLQGIEAYHPSASHGQVKQLDMLARRRGLLVTGGSDFHGDPGSRAALGGLPSGWRTWREDLEALISAMLTGKSEKSVS